MDNGNAKYLEAERVESTETKCGAGRRSRNAKEDGSVGGASDGSGACGPRYFYFTGLRHVVPYLHNFTCFVKRRWVGRRLIDVMRTEFVAFNSSHYERAIASGAIKVNGESVTPQHRLRENEKIDHVVFVQEPPVLAGSIACQETRVLALPAAEWRLPDGIDSPREQAISPTGLVARRAFGCQRCAVRSEICIVAETTDFVAVDKPTGIPVHSGGGYRWNSLVGILGTQYPRLSKKHLLNAERGKKRAVQSLAEGSSAAGKGASTSRQGHSAPPSDEPVALFPLHRIDRLTSGLVLFAKTTEFASVFSAALRRSSSFAAELEFDGRQKLGSSSPPSSLQTSTLSEDPAALSSWKGCDLDDSGTAAYGPQTDVDGTVGVEKTYLARVTGDFRTLLKLLDSDPLVESAVRLPFPLMLKTAETDPPSDQGSSESPLSGFDDDHLLREGGNCLALKHPCRTTAKLLFRARPLEGQAVSAIPCVDCGVSLKCVDHRRGIIRPDCVGEGGESVEETKLSAGLRSEVLGGWCCGELQGVEERVGKADDRLASADPETRQAAAKFSATSGGGHSVCQPVSPYPIRKSKECATRFLFVDYNPRIDESLILCFPRTGRTHQIRVHLRHLGHPISNDVSYNPLFDVSRLPLLPFNPPAHLEKSDISGESRWWANCPLCRESPPKEATTRAAIYDIDERHAAGAQSLDTSQRQVKKASSKIGGDCSTEFFKLMATSPRRSREKVQPHLPRGRYDYFPAIPHLASLERGESGIPKGEGESVYQAGEESRGGGAGASPGVTFSADPPPAEDELPLLKEASSIVSHEERARCTPNGASSRAESQSADRHVSGIFLHSLRYRLGRLVDVKTALPQWCDEFDVSVIHDIIRPISSWELQAVTKPARD